MPLMGSIYVGTSGLQTSQNALNTTAHNMTNIDTRGFVRQQVLMGNREYNTISRNAFAVNNQQIGMGVNYTKTRQVRDYFLDQTYRKETGRSAFFSTSATALGEIETLTRELYGKSFGDSLGGLKDAVSELVKSPNDPTRIKMFIQRSEAFVRRSAAVYDGLTDYQDNLNLQVKKSVDTINEYGKSIKALNEQIVSVLAGGTESPNDLLDARNQLLDELAGYANISYEEDALGAVTVSIEGEPFVSGDSVYQMALDQDERTGFYTPFWPQNATFTTNADGVRIYDISNAKVFDLTKKVTSESEGDVGQVRGLLLARGDHHANYADLEDRAHYNANIKESVIMNVQAEFDRLIHSVVTKINSIFAAASDPDTGYMCDTDGNPIQIFKKIATPGYDAAGNYIEEENPPNPARTDTLYTVTNLQINADLMQDPSLLSFFNPKTEKVDQVTADKLAAAFSEELYSLNPNMTKKSNFTDYYSDLVSQVGNAGKVYRALSENQDGRVNACETARQQITGVSNDEELTNMIKFQNAYNASSRYINVISEMLEHIISTLGRS